MDVVVGLGSGRGSSCHCIRLALVWTSRRSALREVCLHVAWWEGVDGGGGREGSMDWSYMESESPLFNIFW